MGKKKVQKTKELSVAIAEASSAGDAPIQQEPQVVSPRRRGRPRKILGKVESEEKSKEPAVYEVDEEGAGGGECESLSKKAKSSERREVEKSIGHGERKDKEQSEPKSFHAAKKEGTVPGTKEASKTEASSSRAKRKNKPRKSSSR